MRTVAETPVFVRYAAEVWSDAERQEFINYIAANPDAGDIIRESGGCPPGVGKEMRRGQAARVSKVKLPAAAEARASVGLSQQEFAKLLGVSARTLLKVAVKHPKLLRAL